MISTSCSKMHTSSPTDLRALITIEFICVSLSLVAELRNMHMNQNLVWINLTAVFQIKINQIYFRINM